MPSSMAKPAYTASLLCAHQTRTSRVTIVSLNRDQTVPQASSSLPKAALRGIRQVVQLVRSCKEKSASRRSCPSVRQIRISTKAPALQLMAQHVLPVVNCVQRAALRSLSLHAHMGRHSRTTSVSPRKPRRVPYRLSPRAITVCLLIRRCARLALCSPMGSVACLQRLGATVCSIVPHCEGWLMLKNEYVLEVQTLGRYSTRINSWRYIKNLVIYGLIN